MLLFGVIFPIGGAPAALSWLLLLPVLALAWVLRSQTTITATDLRTRGLLSSRSVAWTQVKGVRFPKYRAARAVLLDGSELRLPAVGFDRLRELAAHSGGRIPDLYAAPEQERITAPDADEDTSPSP